MGASTLEAPSEQAAREAEEALAAAEDDQFPEGAADDPQAPGDDTERVDADAPRSASTAQATIDGAWEEIVGGRKPDEHVAIFAGGAFHLPGSEELRKGQVVEVLVRARVGGYASDDTIDPETQEPMNTKEKKKLRVLGAELMDTGVDGE